MHRAFYLLITLFLAGCGPSKQKLNVLYYPDSFDPAILAEFERQFDCQVVMDAFVAGASTESKLAAGGAEVYDVVGTGMDGFSSISMAGLAAPLRLEHIPNLRHVEARFRNLPFDPGNRFTVPYLWGVIGLCVRTQPSVEVDESWSLIFDPAKQAGSFALMDEMRTCMGSALRYLGFSVNTVEPGQLAAARDLLIQTKRRSLGFEPALGISHRVLSGSLSAAISWNEAAVVEASTRKDVRFIVPREGACLAMDSFFITSKAPHRDLAEKFLNYLLSPEVAAKNAAYLKAGTPNAGALALLGQETRTNRVIYPTDETMARLEFLDDLKDKSRLYDEIWTQIKSR